MARVEEYALGIGDSEWRARLWLALAVHLLRLVEKQDDPKLASVLYVEAIKLLDVLTKSLESKQMPGGVPFAGTHGIGEEEAGEQNLWPHISAPIRQNLLNLHNVMVDSIHDLRVESNSTGFWVRYYLPGIPVPVMTINEEHSLIHVRLAVETSIFQTDAQWVKPYKTEGPHRTLVDLSALEETEIALGIVRQAIAHLSG